MSIAQVNGLTKKYGAFTALDNISFSVPEGSIVGLLGPNGCGKTTTMKILAGLIKEYHGEVTVGGFGIGPGSKNLISYLPDKIHLPEWMKSRDAVEYFADFYADFDKQKAYEMLHQMGLNQSMNIKTMSKGMQEKLLLSLVMSRRAKLYLLDEPLGGVDPAARNAILDTILKNYSENSSILLSTHLIYDVERIFDHAIIMSYGRIMVSDSVDNIRANTGLSLDEYFRRTFGW